MPERELGPIEPQRRSGSEPFKNGPTSLPFDLHGFWRWSASDLVSNATRGILAEYIVARALGLAKNGIRDEWAPYDLRTDSGITIEVKSSAYIQSWGQRGYSSVRFGIAKSRAYDYSARNWDRAKRQADVYVFALLSHKDQTSLDPLDVSQWEFYVVSTAALDAAVGQQKSIGLKALRQIAGEPQAYGKLMAAVERMSS